MSYKTIIVHADLSRHAPQRLAMAAGLAGEHGAHLIGVATTGVSREVFPHGYPAAPCDLETSYFQPLLDKATEALARFSEIARQAGVASETRLVCDLASEALARLGRFADLVVVSQDDPSEALHETLGRIPEYVAFTCARPVLVAPCAPVAVVPARHVLVAWNGSKEASAALRAALPLLRRAVRVQVASFRSLDNAESSDPRHQADLAAFLARHEVRAEIRAFDRGIDCGRALLELAAQDGHDLIVLGCYGHTQFRELILGGVSRTVLQSATLPVLMAR